MVDSDPLIFTIVLLSSCLGLLCIPMIRYVVRQENRSLVYLFGCAGTVHSFYFLIVTTKP